MSKPAGVEVYQYASNQPAHVRLWIQGKWYVAHRIAWLIMTGDDPLALTVDHINRHPFDNRFANLRLADMSLQTKNRRSCGKSVHKGIYFCNRKQKWIARSYASDKRIYLGSFDTEQEAAAAAAPYYIH